MQAAGSPSELIEQLLCRLGSGDWLEGSTDSKSHGGSHLRLASLLADVDALFGAFTGGGGGKRDGSGEMAAASGDAGPGACRATKVLFSPGGQAVGWRVKVWWTAAGSARMPLHAMRVLANAPQLRTQLLGHHFDTRWITDHALVNGGAAFDGLRRCLRRVGVTDAEAEGLWGVVAAVMLLMHRCRFVDTYQGSSLRCDDDALARAARLLGASADALRDALEQPPLRAIDAEARRDALCCSLYSAAVEWLVKMANDAGMADVPPGAKLKEVDVVSVPGLSRPSPGENRCSVGDLCHNLCLDSILSLYDAAVFTQNFVDCDAEGCKVHPLLDQLRNRPAIERLNPLLQKMSEWKGVPGGPAGPSSWQCQHSTGDTLKYTFPAPQLPPLEAAFRDAGGGFVVSCVLPFATVATQPQKAISAMAELLQEASCPASPQHWVLWVDATDPTPVVSPSVLLSTAPARNHPLRGISGLRIEAMLYAFRVVETSLLHKVGHPLWWHVGSFAARYRALVPALRRSGNAAVAAKLVELYLTAAPQSETPGLVIGRSRIFGTPAAQEELEKQRDAVLNRCAVRIQTMARCCVAQLGLRHFQGRVRLRAACAVIAAYLSARRSAARVAAMRTLAAAEVIAAECVGCALRRRSWRRANGLLGSRLPYSVLRRMLVTQARQRSEFCERVLWDLSRRRMDELRAGLEFCRAAKRETAHRLSLVEQDRLVGDEASSRDLLCLLEASERRATRRGTAVRELVAAEQEARRGVLLLRQDAALSLLVGFADRFRERVQLCEYIGRIDLRAIAGTKLAEVGEALARGRAGRAADAGLSLLQRNFVAGVTEAGGFFCACHGWRVEWEDEERRKIETAEAAGAERLLTAATSGLRLLLPHAEHAGRQRIAGEQRAEVRRLRNGPEALELLRVTERELIRLDEDSLASRLALGALVLSERARRIARIKLCERFYGRTAASHSVIVREHNGRSSICSHRRRAVAEWWLLAPHTAELAERTRRHAAETAESCLRGHLLASLRVRVEELAARAAWAEALEELRLMRDLSAEVDGAARERRRVADALRRRRRSIRAGSGGRRSPSDFLVADPAAAQQTRRPGALLQPTTAAAASCWSCGASLTGPFCAACGADCRHAPQPRSEQGPVFAAKEPASAVWLDHRAMPAAPAEMPDAPAATPAAPAPVQLPPSPDAEPSDLPRPTPAPAPERPPTRPRGGSPRVAATEPRLESAAAPPPRPSARRRPPPISVERQDSQSAREPAAARQGWWEEAPPANPVRPPTPGSELAGSAAALDATVSRLRSIRRVSGATSYSSSSAEGPVEEPLTIFRAEDVW
eukprot:TRINITY_DN21367_c0_g1_i1.p1 TRINITY_DN21367_c0_g1~~TRINITY_DN21367_c0_g1_i1.p1  ORF type:complete len:1558 (+),score=388.73 TRINITY_DN21367_c0_g1_i1:694-4674(+)